MKLIRQLIAGLFHISGFDVKLVSDFRPSIATPAEDVAAAEVRRLRGVIVNNDDHCFFTRGYNHIKYIKNSLL